MGTLRKLLAATLALISLALAVHSVAGEIYGAYLDTYLAEPHLVWDYLNWFTALGVLVTLVYHFQRKRALDRRHQDDSVTFEYLRTNLLLFAAMFLALWFLANWFEELNANGNTPGSVVGFVWITFNACFVVLGAITAWQLWNEGGEAAPATTATSVQAHPMAVPSEEPAREA